MFTVPLMELRSALAAVVQFVDAGKEPDPRCSALRVIPRGDHALVVATDRVSAGCAAVPVLDCDDDADPIDLSPGDVRKVLSVFPKPKLEEGQLYEEFTIRVERDGNDATFTDTSGMFEVGGQLTVPAFEVRDFPDVPGILGGVAGLTLLQATHTVEGVVVTGTRELTHGELWTQAALLARFTTAHRLYAPVNRAELIVSHAPTLKGAGWHIARIGTVFLGAVGAVDVDEFMTERSATDAKQWTTRLDVARDLTSLTTEEA